MGCDAQTPFLEFWSKQANGVGTGRWKKVRSLQVMPVLPGRSSCAQRAAVKWAVPTEL